MLSVVLSAAATEWSNYLKMLLKNGEGKYLEDLDSYWYFVTEYFMAIMSWFWIQKKQRNCISALKQNIVYVWYLIGELFLSVIFFQNIFYPFILLLPHLAQGEAISLLGTSIPSSCVYVFPLNFSKLKELTSLSKDVTGVNLITFK